MLVQVSSSLSQIAPMGVRPIWASLGGAVAHGPAVRCGSIDILIDANVLSIGVLSSH